MIKFIGVYDYTVILTYVNLFAGILGIVNASAGNYTTAIICLLASGISDAFDGAVARTKKNRTDDEKSFGIQLDSLCDVVSFGIAPALLCYYMGVDGILGLIIICFYCMCGTSRLAFFNVLETKRQKKETGCAKSYRGLPITSISIIFPIVYLLKNLVTKKVFTIILHIMLVVIAFLFIIDFSIKKFDFGKFLPKSKK